MTLEARAVHYFLPVTVGLIMLAMGLGLQAADFDRLRHSPRATVGGLFAQRVLLPACGFGAARGFGLGPTLAVGRWCLPRREAG